MIEGLGPWLAGDLSPQARIWTALAPALLAFSYFALGLCAFCMRCLWKGMPRDEETIHRGSTVLVGAFLRHAFFWVIRPLWMVVYRSGLPANSLTALAALLAVGSGVAVAAGRFALGGWLFLGSGILDVLDGRVARVRKTASPAGAALDSVLDRYADGAFLMGLTWYYRDTWVLLPLLAAFLGTSMVPYVRARGEGLGVSLRGGMMQRLERVLFLGCGVAFAPVVEALVSPADKRPMHWLAVAGILFVAGLSNVTAVGRLRSLLRALAPAHRRQRREPWVFLALHSVAGGVATGVDFVIYRGLAEGIGFGAFSATAMGCVAGAVVNYTLNRVFTFRSKSAVTPQFARYTLVSGVSAALNASGVALLLLLPDMNASLGWWLARAAVYLAWNFPAHRDYVFAEAAWSDKLTTPAHAA